MDIGSLQWKNVIRQGGQALGVDVSPEQADQFTRHAEQLVRWNRKVNLTAITDPFQIAVKHFVDSIAAAVMIPADSTMLDLGSGGGFPGIPLKILMPGLKVVLVDASRKKISFLSHVCRQLQLEDISAHQSRGEDLISGQALQGNRLQPARASHDHTKPVLLPSFDIVISRAVVSLAELIAMALPVLAKEGQIVAMRGKLSPAEIASLVGEQRNETIPASLAGDDLAITIKKYTLPFIDAHRALVSIRRRS